MFPVETFLSGGSSSGYALDTFGSGPSFGDTQLFGQRSFFFFGNTGGPLVDYRFGSAVKLISATFVLYNPQQNLEIRLRADGNPLRTEQYFFTTDAYDDVATNPPAAPPETTVLFDNTFPLTDQLFMRSFGGTGAALKTLVIDDPAVNPVPEPSSLAMLFSTLPVFGLGFAAWRNRKRSQQ